MDIIQIRYFIETAEQLHFAHAADRLGITQSTLSRSIQKLEKELGFKLFSRSNKWDVRLTISGEVYLKEAERILHDIENAKNLALETEHGKSGHLIIGSISSMLGQKSFISAMANIRKKLPNVVLEIIDSTSGELPNLLKEHKADLAFLRINETFADDRFICRKLFMDSLMLAVPKNHRLTGKTNVNIADIAHENFVLVPNTVSSVYRNFILDFCRIHGGFSPRIVQEVNNNYTALRLVMAGCGITFVSSAYTEIFNEHLCYLPIADIHPALPMYALYSAERINPLADTFIQEFMRIYKLQHISE